MIRRRSKNCFLSYHHERDSKYLKKLRQMAGGMSISDYSLKSDIGHLTDATIYNKVRSRMRCCSVTVVLIGERTGHRKWIDWEIWASLRGYKHPYDQFKSFKPNGLLAIYLPTDSHSIPNRLKDNIESGYAVSMKWENFERDFENKISYALWKRKNLSNKIRNSRERMTNDYWDFFGIRL